MRTCSSYLLEEEMHMGHTQAFQVTPAKAILDQLTAS